MQHPLSFMEKWPVLQRRVYFMMALTQETDPARIAATINSWLAEDAAGNKRSRKSLVTMAVSSDIVYQAMLEIEQKGYLSRENGIFCVPRRIEVVDDR